MVEGETLELTEENVELVLDEVRPYLMADGGNVELKEIDGLGKRRQLPVCAYPVPCIAQIFRMCSPVKGVTLYTDPKTAIWLRSLLYAVVKLQLQGACGSCPSSTVTMQMGIERKLKERIPEILEVVQIEPEIQGLELTAEVSCWLCGYCAPSGSACPWHEKISY